MSTSVTILRAFKPRVNTNSVTTAVLATNTTISITPMGTQALRLANIGTQTVYIDFSGTATVANSVPLLANTIEVFTIGNDVTSYGIIAGATGSNLTHTLGEGL